MPRLPRPVAFALLVALPWLGSCSESVEFGPEQRFDARERPVQWNVSEKERLQLRDVAPAKRPGAGADGPAAFEAPTPAGWRELPPQPSMFKDLLYEVAGDRSASCYLTASVGGGVEGNIARWYGQLGKRPTTKVTELPQHELMGQPARLVEIEGTFRGVSDSKLLGLIAGQGGQCTTLKLTGPAALVDAERERFLALAKAIRPAAADTTGKPQTGGAGPLTAWKDPDGWKAVEPSSPMRLLSYQIGEATECAVFLTGGDGGGLRGNLDRWQGQMGMPPLTDQEFAALPRIEVFGEEVPLLDRRGRFADAMTQRSFDDALFLAVAALTPDGAFFVKLTGPHAEAQSHRQEFVDFCASLRR